MIKNLVVNGCSYTEESPVYTCWGKHVADQLAVDEYYNLALGGAGNQYILNSTVKFLESRDLVAQDTLVLIMWSGIDRYDLLINEDWANHIRQSYSCVPQRNYRLSDSLEEKDHWIFSGGAGGSWRDNHEVARIFDGLYRVSDSASLYKNSLVYFTLLESYLKLHRYKYLFTSFLNQCANNSDYLAELQTQEFSLSCNFNSANWLSYRKSY